MLTLSNILKKLDYYFVKIEFKLVFKDYEYCPFVTSNGFDDKTICSSLNFLEKVIDDFKINGYKFNHIAEMNIITIASKMDMS